MGQKEGFAGNPRGRGTGPPTGVRVKMKTWREEVQGKDEKREGKREGGCQKRATVSKFADPSKLLMLALMHYNFTGVGCDVSMRLKNLSR